MTTRDAEGPRVIKRYANRKLYDTGSGELTSTRKVEALVRNGADIRVIDHDTGADMTGEVLAGIMAKSFADRPAESDIPLLTLLIRTPGELLSALIKDEQRTEELRAMGERVRLLSATIDALLSTMEPPAEPAPAAKAVRRPSARTTATPKPATRKGA